MAPVELARVAWEGDSKRVLESFSKEVKAHIGRTLFLVQQGKIPFNIRPMQSIGPGVFEIKEGDERSWYRVIYLSRVGDTIYVLHCFEKKSGKTSRHDIKTASLRLGRLKQRLLKDNPYEKSR